jgi:Na+-driven multidrug efflux pump
MTIGWAPSFALPNALRAAGDAKYVMFVASISMWTVRVSAAYLMAFFFHIGPLGVWLGMGLDFIARGTFYIIRWRGGKWMNKKVIE